MLARNAKRTRTGPMPPEEDQVNTQSNAPAPQVPEAELDATIKMLQQAPICPRCGANVRGATQTRGQTFNCPGCANPVRAVLLNTPKGAAPGIWLERVSPLDLNAPPPRR